MRHRLFLLAGAVIIVGSSLAVFLTYGDFLAWFNARDDIPKKTEDGKISDQEPMFLKLSPQARSNLGLVSKQPSSCRSTRGQLNCPASSLIVRADPTRRE